MHSKRSRPDEPDGFRPASATKSVSAPLVLACAIGFCAVFAGSCVVDIGEPIVEIDDDPTDTDTDTDPTDTDTDTDDDPITDTDGPGPEPTGTDVPVDPTDDPTDDISSDTDPSTDDKDASMGTDDPAMDPDAGCRAGSEDCDGQCVPVGTCVPPPPPCEETCKLPNAEFACVDDVCTLTQCADGWEDCDGLQENGCEIEFDSGMAAETPFSVPRQTINSDDDWIGIPVYPINVPCSPTECDQTHAGVPNQIPLYIGTTPDPEDMRAGFSMAWDPTGLWIRAVLLDDEWVEGIAPNGSTDPNPFVYDHLQFVFDGANQTNYGDPADHHLFMGIDDEIFDQRDSGGLRQKVDVDTTTVGKCRVMVAKLSEAYLSADNQTPIAGTSKVFGFSIEVNDFDRNDEAPMEVQRQHQLFFEKPGPKYVYGQPRDLPDLVLAP